MGKINRFLISIDFRSEKGGIARVANLMYHSLSFDKVYSLNGTGGEGNIKYFNNNRALYLLRVLYVIFFKRPEVLVFDHLNIARLLALVPKSMFKKVVLFVYDEEVWREVTGLRKTALLKTTDILCISDHSMQKFLNANPEFKEKAKLCLLAGVPKAFLEKNEASVNKHAEWVNDKAPYWIFVSRLWKVHRYKGHFELLEAFKLHYQSSNNPSLRLAIIGNGDDAPEVEAFIQKENLSGLVKLFTGLSDPELVQFYRNSSGLIFPSTREGFGFVFLEAMFFKKPCVGIVDQPAEEIIIKGETGELLPNKSPQELLKALRDIEENKGKYEKYGEAGHKRYWEYFTNDHFKQRFLKAINL